MDQATRKYIEQSLNIKLGDQISRGTFEYVGCLSEVVIDELVENKFAALEWQDPTSHDCRNADGVLYVYLPFVEDVSDELFIGVDVAANVILVS